MHRNTLLFMSLLAVVAALLIGVNVGKRLQTPVNTADTLTPSPLPTPSVSEISLLPYVSPECGISFLYPSNLTKVDSATSGAIFVDSSNNSDSIAFACQEDIPRPPISLVNIEKLTLFSPAGASISATLYHDANPKDGTPADRIIFYHPTMGLDVYISSSPKTIQELLLTLKLL